MLDEYSFWFTCGSRGIDACAQRGGGRGGFRSGSRTSCGHGSDMSSDRGFCDSTISYWDRCARRFLIWCNSTSHRLRNLEASDFDSYIAHLAAGGCSRRSISNVVKALRSFVRFAGNWGWCRKHLAEGIEGPRVYSNESLPMGHLLGSLTHLSPYMTSVNTTGPAEQDL